MEDLEFFDSLPVKLKKIGLSLVAKQKLIVFSNRLRAQDVVYIVLKGIIANHNSVIVN
jgi:hypothetical protein